MRLETRTFVFVAVDRIAGSARHGRARRSGAGIAGPRERRRRGSAGAKPPGSSRTPGKSVTWSDGGEEPLTPAAWQTGEEFAVEAHELESVVTLVHAAASQRALRKRRLM